MIHRPSMSRQEMYELLTELCEQFKDGKLSESDFRISLGALGCNATDIEDLIKEHRPPAPENDDGDFG